MTGSSVYSGAVSNTDSTCSVAAASTGLRLEQLEREHIVEECPHFALPHFGEQCWRGQTQRGGSAHALVKPLAGSGATGTADS